MGKLFSKEKKDKRIKVGLYGQHGHFENYPVSPSSLLLNFLHKEEVTSNALEFCKHNLENYNVPYGGDCALIGKPSANNKNEDFQFHIVEIGGRSFWRPLVRMQEKDAKAKIFFLFANQYSDDADWFMLEHSSFTYGSYRIKQVLTEYTTKNPSRGVDKNFSKLPALFFVQNLGKEEAKTQSEIELALGLNEAKFPYHLQAVDLFNNGAGIDEGLQWLKSALTPTTKSKKCKRTC